MSGTSASVSTNASIVAMSGSIIPTPLATPTMLAVSPSVVGTFAEATFGRVSVVIMAVATSTASCSAGQGANVTCGFSCAANGARKSAR